MLLDFEKLEEINISKMNNGIGDIRAQMYMYEQGKIILSSIHSGSSIGLHKHATSDDINYFLSGKGKAICDGKEEILYSGVCHICEKGSEHSIINTGFDDLILLTVVIER